MSLTAERITAAREKARGKVWDYGDLYANAGDKWDAALDRLVRFERTEAVWGVIRSRVCYALTRQTAGACYTRSDDTAKWCRQCTDWPKAQAELLAAVVAIEEAP